MNDNDKTQLGKTLWAIADRLRGAMNADDFRDYMLSFLFLRYHKAASWRQPFRRQRVLRPFFCREL